MLRRGPLQLPLCFLCLLCLSSKLTVLGEGPYECSQGGHGAHDLIENGVMNQKYMWYKRGHKTYVPVVMDHSYSHKEHSVIVGGLKEIQQKTCVEFDIYDNEAEVEEKDYVHITKNTKRGCYSYIGRIGGKQEIGLPIGCISHRTAMHEMLHALGFRHEHVRYDRDDYIIVFWGNIRQGRESNFKKRTPSDLVSGPYDYDSIMHYERKAFSRNGQDTIRPLKLGASIGTRQEMSYWDAQKVNVVYKCGGQYSNSDGDHFEHSPALLRYNEDHDRNESLPIAEYDDFNSDQSRARSADPHPHPHPDHLHQHRNQGGRSGPLDHDFNELDSFSDDHYDNNENNENDNRNHNHNHNRPFQSNGGGSGSGRERPGPGDDYHNGEGGGYHSPLSSSSNDGNDNAEPYYDVFYDF